MKVVGHKIIGSHSVTDFSDMLATAIELCPATEEMEFHSSIYGMDSTHYYGVLIIYRLREE
jgi:hypothetical protein